MPSAEATSPKPLTVRQARRTGKPFFGVIESVIVEDPVDFEFDGAISREHAEAAWTWMWRDLAPEAIDPSVDEDDPATQEAFEALRPELVTRARDAIAAAGTSFETERRLIAQLGGEDAWTRLPTVVNALKCRVLLEKAQAFGRATNSLADEDALANALGSMPLSDQMIASLLMQAAMGQVANPARLMVSVVRIAGSPDEAAIVRTGFAPLVDAILAHAQNQIPSLLQIGPFADVDLACRAIDRFHRLIRAVSGFVELNRNGRWAMIVAALTKQVASRVEPRLREVVTDLNNALRPQRSGKADADQTLNALNSVYLLKAVRDARESLALNALFDQIWTQVGQSLEIHIEHNLEALRRAPGDSALAAQVDAIIKMAELRFNPEYADVLRRAKESAERR